VLVAGLCTADYSTRYEEVNCSPAPEEAKASPAPEEAPQLDDDAKRKNELEGMIKKEIGTPSASDPCQCKLIGFGTQGFQGNYLVYSTANTDEPRLKELVFEFNLLEKTIRQESGLGSILGTRDDPPNLGLVAGVCTADYSFEELSCSPAPDQASFSPAPEDHSAGDTLTLFPGLFGPAPPSTSTEPSCEGCVCPTGECDLRCSNNNCRCALDCTPTIVSPGDPPPSTGFCTVGQPFCSWNYISWISDNCPNCWGDNRVK
jgi:hypothetical protein